MLKYKSIIDKLTVEQKLLLASSVRSFSLPWAEQNGLSTIIFSDMEKVNAETDNLYPSFSALANSWNTNLTCDVSKELAEIARKKDAVNLLFTPRLGVKCNPYCDGISEDPYLAGTYAEAVSRGVSDAEVMPCL